MLAEFLTMLRDDDGQGLVEYALIMALVSIVAIGGLTFVGAKANNTLSNAANQPPDAPPSNCGAQLC